MADQGKALAAQYDLTGKLMPFLDRHLIYPLFDFLQQKQLYDETTVLELKYNLLKDAYMPEFVSTVWSELHKGEPVPDFVTRQEKEVSEAVAKYETCTAKVLTVFENPEVVNSLKQDKLQNLELLQSKYNVSIDDINDLYQYSQLQYNRGEYQAASDLLYHFRVLTTDSQLITSATWGKFAADIVSLQWDSAMEELQKLRDIDQRPFSDPLAQLHHRTWIIHWSLFPFFRKEGGKEALCDLFFTSPYISAIQAACPWILRYLTAAVVSLTTPRGLRTNSNFQRRLKELVRVVEQEQYEYKDPITEFIRALYVDYDFEGAQAKLAEAEQILANDFFLESSADAFLESARHLISELYCRVHQRVDVAQLSDRLNLSRDQGEQWIAHLIQDMKMDAKIDESEGTVSMNLPVTSVYQQVIERTKDLTFRSNQMLTQAQNKNGNVMA